MDARAAAAILLLIALTSCGSQPETTTVPPPPEPEPSPVPTAAEADPDPVGFDGRVIRLPRGLREEMRGTTWRPGCPVPLDDLRLLRLTYRGFDGRIRRGPMVVHEDVAEDVLWVFGRLFRARFPLKHVALTREFVPEDFEPRISSPRSVTAAFNCRPVITPRGPLDDFSQHSYGWAIDINPVQNPYVTGDGFVRNLKARRYVDRSRRLPGMIHDGDVVVRSFAAIGWSWGGNWRGGQDYMHFVRSA